MKSIQRYLVILLAAFLFLTACGPLNPVNDFFGIRMNIDEEANFKIVSYNDVDGVKYQNSINMDPKINAWAEISANEVTIKVVNNSDADLPINYTTDQFIIITNEQEYILGKGERENYVSQISISPNSSKTFVLELPVDYTKISQSPSQSSETSLTREVMRDYSKSGTKLNVNTDNIKYIVVKIGSASILLKKVPNNK
ncbi:MAG: hypothetical protein KDC67_10320 [Ignavibacteriae bacterium]|nr:hypothetical protein [Ignavibacteriota bacterium]